MINISTRLMSHSIRKGTIREILPSIRVVKLIPEILIYGNPYNTIIFHNDWNGT